MSKRFDGTWSHTLAGTTSDGVVTSWATWNVALTDAEIAALAVGAPPRTLRPGSFTFFGHVPSSTKE